MRRMGKIKTKTASKYQIYELLRKSKCGGGLAIGVLKELNPVWVSEGNDEVEILVVEINLNGIKIRIINAYGPQEKEKVDIKTRFWDRMDFEISQAENLNCGIILQMDGNLKAGQSIIPADPLPQSYNGKLFANLLAKHPNLSVVNSLPQCEGVITRRRQTTKGLEESVIDFFVVCDRILPLITKMKIDEKQETPLTNYDAKNKNKKATDSDHFSLFLELSLMFNQGKAERREVFNFRNKHCQNVFRELTSNTTKFSEVFQNDLSFQDQAKKWGKTLNSFFHQSFRKIRVNNKAANKNHISELIDKRNALKKKLNQIMKDGVQKDEAI